VFGLLLEQSMEQLRASAGGSAAGESKSKGVHP
jgi:hypothetical protein